MREQTDLSTDFLRKKALAGHLESMFWRRRHEAHVEGTPEPAHDEVSADMTVSLSAVR